MMPIALSSQKTEIVSASEDSHQFSLLLLLINYVFCFYSGLIILVLLLTNLYGPAEVTPSYSLFREYLFLRLVQGCKKSYTGRGLMRGRQLKSLVINLHNNCENMKFKGITRFFESFRNLIRRLKSGTAIPQESSEFHVPETPKLSLDFEIVKREDILSNSAQKDRIGIKPKKNHPKQMKSKIFDSNENLSDAISVASSNFIDLDIPPKKLQKEISDSDNNTIPKVALKVPPKFLKDDIPSKDLPDVDKNRNRIEDGDDNDGNQPLASSSISLSSLCSTKSFNDSEKKQLETTEIKENQSSPPSEVDKSSLMPNSVALDTTYSNANLIGVKDVKSSQKESLTSVSSPNDLDIFFQMKTIISADSDANLSSFASSGRAPVPIPRKDESKLSIASSNSLKLYPSDEKPTVTPLNKNLTSSKSSLSSREAKSNFKPCSDFSQGENRTENLPSSPSSKDEELNNDGLDETQIKDEVFEAHEKSSVPGTSEVDELFSQQNQEQIKAGDFYLKFADIESLKFTNLSILHSDEDKDDFSTKTLQLDMIVQGGGDNKLLKFGDGSVIKPQTPISPGAEASNGHYEKQIVRKSSDLLSKSDKPQTKIPPAVPTKPKVSKT